MKQEMDVGGTYPPALPEREGALSTDEFGSFPSQCFV